MTCPEFVAPHLPGLLHQSGKLWMLLAGGTVLMLLGLADDRRGLDWRLRLGVQTAGGRRRWFRLGWRMSLFLDMPWLTGALSVLWIVGLVNSFNMLDNMDGLSAGVAAIAAAMFAAVMLLTPRPDNNQPQLFVAGLAAGDRRLAAGLPLAQPAAGPAVHGRCRQLPGRLSAGDGHADGHVRRRRPAEARHPRRRCACWPCRSTIRPAWC